MSNLTPSPVRVRKVALIEAGSPGLNIYSHVAMGRGVALLATVLRHEGFECTAFVEDISGRGSVDWDYVAECDAVGFSTITCTMPRTLELLEELREVNPDAVTVFGGPESTCEPDRSLDAGADFVLKGEAERTLPQFLRELGSPDPGFHEIAGLVWRTPDGRVERGPEARQLTREELDELPLLDHRAIHGPRPTVAPVWHARGCPERCDFCEVCEIWPRYVRRAEDRCVAELVQAQDEGYSAAFLIDDNAAANKPAFKEFLRKTAEGGFARMLVTQLRADAVLTKEGKPDRELLRLLRRAASVTVVCVGVESADASNLERMHKKMDDSRMANGLKAMRRYGLVVHGMFIALNEDTREVVKRNGDYARRYVSSLQYLFETPLPGTKRTREHIQRGAMLFDRIDDLSFFDGMHVVLRPLKMAPREMQDLVAREYRRFYSVRRTVYTAVKDTFARNRRLSEAQKAFLGKLDMRQRLKWWTRFHIEYKYAPTSFLAIGRRRIKAFMRDREYAEYTARLETLGGSLNTVACPIDGSERVDQGGAPR
jgi:radical SAM superfamily enzyme YgiQ (UPF0313 family)